VSWPDSPTQANNKRLEWATRPRQEDNLQMQVAMTEVIAVRRFWWEGETGRELVVSIGKPQQAPGGNGEFYCPIQLTGFGDDKFVQPIFGVDGFQAIELALKFIGYRLSDIDQKNGGRLRWEFGDDGRLPKEWAQNSGS
jgi:hypothetical protein